VCVSALVIGCFSWGIRIGDYWIGLFFEEGLIIFAYLAHRKDIYNKFF